MKTTCRNCGQVYDEKKLDEHKICVKCKSPSESTYGGSIDDDDDAIASILEGSIETVSDLISGLPETYGGFSGDGGDSGGGGASGDW